MIDGYPSDCELTQFLRERAEQHQYAPDLLKRAGSIKLLLLDVDGILTDGSIPYTATGEEIKTFNSKDGFGLNILQKIGVQIGLITARKSEALIRRARDLKIVHLYQGARNKVAAFEEIITHLDLTPAETAFMGDDWLDMPLLAKVGFAATVSDAVPEVRALAHYVTDNPGGRGGVREVCDLIVEAHGKREWLLNHVEEL